MSHDLATERCALQIENEYVKLMLETTRRVCTRTIMLLMLLLLAGYSACRRLGSFVLICHRVCLSHLVWFAATHARTHAHTHTGIAIGCAGCEPS